MSRHFALDFDGTLIDTDVYWEWVVEQFLGFGHEERTVRAAGEKLFPLCYTVVQHARDLGMDEASAQQLAEHARKHVREGHASLIFPDVPTFFSNTEHMEKSVLTFGDHEHQTERVLASGIPISQIHVATSEYSKAAHLTNLVNHSSVPITFIDDDTHQLQGVHQAGLPVDLIRMRRPGQRKSKDEHPLDNEAWRVIESLNELE